jgi:hypothetical protein
MMTTIWYYALIQKRMILFFAIKIDNGQEDNVAEVNLKKLSRAELLEMMIAFSEEAEAAKKREAELTESFENERLKLQEQMAEERALMLKNFDEEKAEMRAKFAEQKAEMQAKFDKDITGLKARLDRERSQMQGQVDDSLSKIQNSNSLAEASLKLGGVFDSAQKAVDLYVATLKKSATEEYQELLKEIDSHKKRMALLEKQAAEKAGALSSPATDTHKLAETKADEPKATEEKNKKPEAEEPKPDEIEKPKKTTRKRASKKAAEETDE